MAPMKFSGKSTFSIGALFSSVQFNYLISGIITPVVLLVGAVGNIVTLFVLCQKSLSSVPAILLQCLTVQALLDSLIAVHMDVIPALKGSWATAELFVKHDLHSMDLHAHEIGHIHENGSFHNIFDFIHMAKHDQESLKQFINPKYSIRQNKTSISTMTDVKRYTMLLKEDNELDLVSSGKKFKYGVGVTLMTRTKDKADVDTKLQNTASIMCGINSANARTDTPTDVNMTGPTRLSNTVISKCNTSTNMNESLLQDHLHRHGHVITWEAFERYAVYVNEHFGQLVTMVLALQQGIAITWPEKSTRFITINRTKILIIVLALLCCGIGIPNLIQEVSRADHDHPETRAVVVDEHALAMWTSYFTKFYAALSLVFAILLALLNMSLLQKQLDVQRVKDTFLSLKRAQQPGRLTPNFRNKFRSLAHLRHITLGDVQKRTQQLKQKCIELKKMKEGDKSGVNSSLFVVILVFFRLPVQVCQNTIDLISFGDVFEDVALVAKAVAVFRLVGLVQSASSFFVFFIFAKKFRKVMKRLFKNIGNTIANSNRNSKIIMDFVSTPCSSREPRNFNEFRSNVDHCKNDHWPEGEGNETNESSEDYSELPSRCDLESVSLDGEKMYNDVKQAIEKTTTAKAWSDVTGRR